MFCYWKLDFPEEATRGINKVLSSLLKDVNKALQTIPTATISKTNQLI